MSVNITRMPTVSESAMLYKNTFCCITHGSRSRTMRKKERRKCDRATHLIKNYRIVSTLAFSPNKG